MIPRLYFGSGWKMNKTAAEARAYIREFRTLAADLDDRHFLFIVPSFTALWAAKEEIAGTPLRLGAQNMHWEEEGSFTGEISPPMLAEIGIDLVELGHSERRRCFAETDESVNRKVLAALHRGWCALVCVGESMAEKENAVMDEVLAKQVRLALRGVRPSQAGQIMLAYEPIWAIGDGGIPAPPDYAARRHEGIRRVLQESLGTRGNDVPILYGGSVSWDNARVLTAQPEVDGLFIGRASWDARGFYRIIKAASD